MIMPKQDRDRGGEKDERARVVGRKLRSQEGPHHPGGDESGAKDERQRD